MKSEGSCSEFSAIVEAEAAARSGGNAGSAATPRLRGDKLVLDRPTVLGSRQDVQDILSAREC